jgi:hypothetical protein
VSHNDENPAPAEATLVPVAVPAPVPELDVLVEQPDFNAQQGRPLLGGSLWTFGALLWAYLVMGELVVNAELNEPFAMLIVTAALGIAWYGAVRHAPPGNLPRKIAPGLIGIAIWIVALFLAAVTCGTTRRSTIEALTVVFLLPALGAYFVGRRLTANPKLELSRRRRAAEIVLWVSSGLVTAVSLIAAAERM